MKIALLGYGKMGQVIERIAIERGHEIILKKTRTTPLMALQMLM
jgi:4-hydroxy-tetrahydrodipicolinate reductase